MTSLEIEQEKYKARKEMLSIKNRNLDDCYVSVIIVGMALNKTIDALNRLNERVEKLEELLDKQS